MMPPSQKNGALYLYQWMLDALYGLVRFFQLFKKSPSLAERLGFYPPETAREMNAGRTVWIHAASAGEVNAITPFCKAFQEAAPEVRLVLTTTSETGKKLVFEKGTAPFVFLAPLDMIRPLRRAFQTFRPVLILVAETEFWPNWLFRAAHNQVPVMLINGRISNKSFPAYRKLRFLFEPVLRCFRECLVQTGGDRDKLIQLGFPEKRIQVVGQMKYDLTAPDAAKAEAWGKSLGFESGHVLVTFGSLREGEDDQVIPLIPGLLSRYPKLKIILAPRHVKNAEVFQNKLSALQVPSALRSLSTPASAERVLVIDTVGELSLAYHLSRAAFVGGTLVPVGGHNVMEPALSAVPVLFGPYVQNVQEAAEALLVSGGGFQVQKAEELVSLIEKLLDPEASRAAGQKALAAVTALRGATDKNLRPVLAYLSNP